MKTTLALVYTLLSSVATSPLQPLALRHAGALSPRDDCPQFQSREFLVPQLIVPISASQPDRQFGFVSNPIITPNDICTIFNLYIPGTATGRTCTLEFLLHALSSANPPYSYSGSGSFSFSGYVGYGATAMTTWKTQPLPGDLRYNPPNQTIVPGNRYVLNQPYPGSCLVNGSMSYLEVGGRLCSSDTSLTYFQDWNRCPTGFLVEISLGKHAEGGIYK
ncbi:hypothetical protein BU26DRAFT_565225 [Trematosphaeria pertusa]|uniref:Ubiquitin 3 binding protein But2 C-terminal domain-containing protein n=1 Tax=Trematosphaeria pertusa TaxID=390896 RepID=A0A6A6IJ41_9PLEO|nr:uncharacterized protein BU26DRAFT_565225 [Trematosphaeria pertusa]KAF2249590.1 hypothetical protein BU26DRAFT_565225 [Trematosphaeria pertusa]